MSNWRIIGSTALHHWFPGYRIPVDIDVLTPAKISGNDPHLCIVDTHWHGLADTLIRINVDPVFLDADLLFTLKVSHAHWNIKWEKTIADIRFMQSEGCKLNEEIYLQLLPIWATVHRPKQINLNQTNSTFFADKVSRRFDHDEIHQFVKFNGVPMHEKIRPDLSSARCCKKLFDKLTQDQQVQCALEEILTVAIERGQLWNAVKTSEKTTAVFAAYKSLCVTMTSGWFAKYLILSGHELLNLRKPQWRTQLETALLQIKTSKLLGIENGN